MNHIKLRTIFQLLVILAAPAIACTKTEPGGYTSGSGLDTDADITGYIADIQPSAPKDTLVRILVEMRVVTTEGTREDKYVITVEAGTPIFRQVGKNHKEASFDDFEIQQLVHVWFDGPVAESYPMQARAQQVVIDTESGNR